MEALHLGFLLLVLHPFCVAIDTITIDQSITDSNLLISRERTFALGFFSPGSSKLKYLGIWYNQLPGQTVVWVANRNTPINGSSGILTVKVDGNLVLYGNKGEDFPVWSTNVSLTEESVYEAQLLDSGNLILVQNESKRIVWQSFDYPTDTLIPGMKLGLDRRSGLNWFLTSWRSVDDPGIGDYSYKLNPTGSPQFFLYKGSTPYWRTYYWPWMRRNVNNYTFVDNQNETSVTSLGSGGSIVTRVVVLYSGLAQRFLWDSGSNQWRETRSTSSFKYGHCGAYSICNGNNVENFECTCLPGYQPKTLSAWALRDGSGGCVRKSQQISMCRNGEGFVKVGDVKIPDTSIAALVNLTMSSTECEQLCLRNCSCVAFSSLDIERKGVGCLTWYGELMDTTVYTEGRELHLRVDAVELEHARKTRGSLLSRRKWVIPLLSVALTVVLILLFAYLWRKKNIKNKGRLIAALTENELKEGRRSSDLPIFDLGTILAATNSFSPASKLGQGGFGSVYKGQLPDGQDVAVKRLSKSSAQGIKELRNEVLLIARLQHRNLVKLLGCCIQGEEQMLIYEYLPNKSLDLIIFDPVRRSVLSWRRRFDIIVGIASGILYLHHDSRLRIIHRDLKTSNILLDAEMKPKISDFGLARIFEGGDQVQDKTKRIVGTYGYMSPEYALFGNFSLKSDVFSYGVIMLEIISGKKSSTCFQNDHSLNLLVHVWDLWRGDRALEIADISITESFLPPQVLRCIHIGLLCVQEDPTVRPTMPEVVLMLNGERALPQPKQPAYIFRRNSSDLNPSNTAGVGVCSVNDMTVTNFEGR